MSMTEADNLLSKDPGPNQSVAKVPPPPVDISIRTLESDLASFALTGGTKPKAQIVSLSPSDYSPVAGAGASLLRRVVVILIAIVVVGALAYVGYRLYLRATDGSTSPTTEEGPSAEVSVTRPPTQPPPPPAVETPVSTTPVAVPDFIHQSFFRKPVDQTIDFVLPAPQNAGSDLQTFSQRMARLFNTVNPKGSFFELKAQATGGKALSFGQFIYTINAPILGQEFLAATFNPDFTFFVYKDADGYWPGYVLSLQPNLAWLYAAPEVAKLEKSPSLEVLFATVPGGRAGDFTDDKIESQPVRALGFSNASANFTYGWLRNNLIISTSKEGFRQALGRL